MTGAGGHADPLPGNRAVFRMKALWGSDNLHGGAVAASESRFEQPEIGPYSETAVCAHFGRKLQKVFPLPSRDSEPDNFRVLLRQIQAKLGKSAVPGEG